MSFVGRYCSVWALILGMVVVCGFMGGLLVLLLGLFSTLKIVTIRLVLLNNPNCIREVSIVLGLV